MKNLGTKKGSSLIGVIVYVVLLIMVVVVISSSLIYIHGSYRKVKVAKNIKESASLSLERLSREIKKAENIDDATSAFGVTLGSLGLQAGATSTVFYIESGKIKMKQNNVEIGDLTISDVHASSLIFNKIVFSDKEAVKVEVTLQSTSGNASTTANFYLTTALRN